MSRFHLVDSATGEVVGQYSYKPTSRVTRTYRRRRSLLEQVVSTHEGQIAIAVVLGIIVGSSVHP